MTEDENFIHDGVFYPIDVTRAYVLDIFPRQKDILLLGSLMNLIKFINIETQLVIFYYNGYNINTGDFVSVQFILERNIEGKISTYNYICVITYLDEIDYFYSITKINNQGKILDISFYYGNI